MKRPPPPDVHRPPWERYEGRLLEAMGLAPLASEPLPAASGLYRALFQPAFHRNTAITVRDRGTVVEVVVADGHVRERVMQALGVRGIAGDARSHAPEIEVRRAPLSRAGLKPFAAALASVDTAGLLEPEGLGLDGVRVLDEWRDARGTRTFRAWSPSADQQPMHHRFAMALYTLAGEHLADEPLVRALEHLHVYLGTGLPLHDPRGWIAAPRPAVRPLVDPRAEPVLMDLRNFETMVELALYPLLRGEPGRGREGGVHRVHQPGQPPGAPRRAWDRCWRMLLRSRAIGSSARPPGPFTSTQVEAARSSARHVACP